MTTTIVIPVFNGREFLSTNLPAILTLHANEIIIVDDASSDGSADFISSKYPSIKIIKHKTNQRFPKTVNDGFTTAKGDIVFLLNQDTKPHPDLIKNAICHFINNPRLFAVTFNEAQRSWPKVKMLAGFLEHTNGTLDDKLHSTLWASGGSAAFRNTIWQELGGFDTSFTPGYYEDLDIGWRAWRRGYQIIWDPKCLISHPTPESAFNKAFKKGELVKIKERNRLITHWKNLDSQDFYPHILTLLHRLSHPGYVIPILQALIYLPNIILYRIHNHSVTSNTHLFTKLK